MQISKIPPISIETDIYEKFKEFVRLEETSLSEKVREFIRDYVDDKREQKPKDRVSELVAKYGGESTTNKNQKKPADSSNYKDILYP
jgi:metal-responsive CopG/Arc/MetJ family transcriptional regulator